MLIVNKNIRSLASEGWMCNFKVVWLYHLFHRSRVHWTRRWAIWSLWVSEQTRVQMSTHLNASYESECHRCWPDICRGPWEGGFWGASSNRRLPYLLSFVTWASWEPRRTTSCAMHLSVFGPGTQLFTQVSFNIGPAKMPSLSWRISCAHLILVLFTLIFTGAIL